MTSGRLRLALAIGALVTAAVVLGLFHHDRPVDPGEPRASTASPSRNPDAAVAAEGATPPAERVGRPADSEVTRAAATDPRELQVRVTLHGDPVPHAELVVLPLTPEAVEALDDPAGPSAAIRSTAIWLHTDVGGAASIPRPPGELYVAVRAAGIAPGAIFCPEDDDEAIFEMAREYSLRGRVVLSDGRPAVGAVVTGRMGMYYGRLIRGWTLEPYRMLGMFFTSTATVDATGSYRLGELPMGFLEIRAALPGYSAAVNSLTDVPVDSTCDLTLYPGASLTGTVVAVDTGLPIEGARVVAMPEAPALIEVGDAADLAYSDADGRFELPGVRGDVPVFGLRVIRSGYAAQVLTVQGAGPGSSRDVRIELKKAVELRGSVRSRTGLPVPLARVKIIDEERQCLVEILNTREDDGSFHADFLEAGRRYTVTAQRRLVDPPAVASAVVVPRETPLAITLERSGLLTGIVSADGHEVADGSVRLLVLGGNFAWRETRTTETQPDGRYEFDLVPEGEHHIDVVVDGFAPTWIEPVRVSAESEVTELNVTLERGAPLAGVVIDATTKERLPDVRLVAMQIREGLASPVEIPLEATSDEHGRYRFDALPVGVPFGIGTADERFARTITKTTIPAAGAEHEVDIELVRGATLEVVARAANGLMVPGYFARVFSEPSTLTGVLPDADGVVRVRRVRPGPTDVEASWGPRNRFIAWQRRVDVPAGGVLRVEFDVSGRGRIWGRVDSHIRNNGVYEVVARPIGSGPPAAMCCFVENEPEYAMEGLAPGRYQVLAWSLTGTAFPFEASRSIDLADGENRQINFELGDGSIAGHVIDDRGDPIPSVRITRATPGDVQTSTSTSTDTRGEFTLVGVESEGTHSLLFTRTGYARLRHDIDTRPDDSSELTVTMSREAVLALSVVDRAGDPVPHAAVRCEPTWDDHPWLITTGAVGADGAPLRVAQLAPGPYRVSASADGYCDAVSTVTLRAGDTGDHTIVLRRPGSLEVRVFGADGVGAPFTPLALESDAMELALDEWIASGKVKASSGGAHTGDDGRLRLDGIPVGRYRVSSRGVTREVEVTTTEPATLTLHGVQ